MASLIECDVTESCRINTETFVTGTTALLGDNAQVDQVAVAAAGSGVALGLAPITVAKLVEFFMVSDQDVSVVFTLATGSLTVALKAGVPFHWKNSYSAAIICPFLYNIVSAAATNAGASAATITTRALVTA